MLTSIAVGIAKSAALGWIWRRAQELVAHATWLVPLFLSIPKPYQELIVDVLRGQGGGYSISVYIGFAGFLWTQFQSYRATVKPQVVTGDGQKIALAPNTRAASEIEARAVTAPRPPRTLWERITGQ